MGIKNSGFTFIEIIIVIGIISITLPMIFGLYFLNLRSQIKIYSLQEVKYNGDNAINTIESLIKNNAASIVNSYGSSTEICNTTAPTPTPATEMNFTDTNNQSFGFYLDNTRLASRSASLSQPSYLTNSDVVISDLTFTCGTANSFSNPTVSVAFTITKKITKDAKAENTASMQYETKVKLRN